MSTTIIAKKNSQILLPTQAHPLLDKINSDWFDIEFWQKANAVTGESRGRNITWFVDYNQQNWVLRHYYRGGLIALFNKDSYLFTGLKKTRCYLELSLLQTMFEQGLPVPQPIAAKVAKHGLFYRADLLMKKIPNAKDLVAHLSRDKLSEKQWQALGKMVALFHQAGVYHSDLNSHNILLDENDKFWLIDFDRCDIRDSEPSWQASNLARLKRSFEKEKGLLKNFLYEEAHWKCLMDGYYSHQSEEK